VCQTTNVNNRRDNGNSLALRLVSPLSDKPEHQSDNYESRDNDDNAHGNGAAGQSCVKLDDQMCYLALKIVRTVGHVWWRVRGERVQEAELTSKSSYKGRSSRSAAPGLRKQ
jgi:hypothetical protein